MQKNKKLFFLISSLFLVTFPTTIVLTSCSSSQKEIILTEENLKNFQSVCHSILLENNSTEEVLSNKLKDIINSKYPNYVIDVQIGYSYDEQTKVFFFEKFDFNFDEKKIKFIFQNFSSIPAIVTPSKISIFLNTKIKPNYPISQQK